MSKTLIAALTATCIAAPALAQSDMLREARINLELRESGWHLIDRNKGCEFLQDVEGAGFQHPRDLYRVLSHGIAGARYEPDGEDFVMIVVPYQGREKTFVLMKGAEKCRAGLRHATNKKG